MSTPKCILLDVEGTTSSISFVYDVMFPFVRENLRTFVVENWESDELKQCLPLLASELGHQSLEAWFEGSANDQVQESVMDGVIELMDGDVKATGLKKVQGLIWKHGFESGELVAHLYDDVCPAIDVWTGAGIEVRIYSSGSIQAQKLFFGHCVAGNLLPKISGHYDTTIGNKKEAQSYEAISNDCGFAASEVLFVSDVVAELQAAQAAGMQTRLSVRPGNPVVENDGGFAVINSFAEITLSKVASDG